MTVTEMLRRQSRDRRAITEARRQYDRAVERHFADAHWLVTKGWPDQAEHIAKAAVALRMDAHYELAE